MAIKTKQISGLLVGMILAGIPFVYVPFFFHPYELPKYLLFQVLSSVLLLISLISLFSNEKYKFPKLSKYFVAIISLYLFGLFASTTFSSDPFISFWGTHNRHEGLFQYSFYILFFFSLLLLSQNLCFKKITKAICYSAILISIVAIIEKIIHFRVFASFGQPNFLASYLGMALPFCFLSFANSKRGKSKKLLLALPILAILFTGSRAVILAILAALSIYSFLKNKKLLKVPFSALALIFIFNLFPSLVQSNELLSRFLLSSEAFQSVLIRFQSWPSIFEMALMNPVWGHGLETFSSSYPPFQSSTIFALGDFNNSLDKAHNLVLDTFVSTGLFGIISYLFLIGYFFTRKANRKVDKPLVHAAKYSVLILLLSNLFSFSTVVNHIYFWFCLALVIRFSSRGDVCSFRIGKLAKLSIFSFIILLVIGSITQSIRRAYADYNYRQGIVLESMTRNLDAQRYFKRSIKYAPTTRKYMEHALEHSNLAIKYRSGSVEDKLVSNSQLYLRELALISPEDSYFLNYELGRFYLFTEKYDLALEVFDSLSIQYATETDLHYHRAITAVESGKSETSAIAASQYLELFPFWALLEDFNSLNETEINKIRLYFISQPNKLKEMEEMLDLLKVNSEKHGDYLDLFLQIYQLDI